MTACPVWFESTLTMFGMCTHGKGLLSALVKSAWIFSQDSVKTLTHFIDCSQLEINHATISIYFLCLRNDSSAFLHAFSLCARISVCQEALHLKLDAFFLSSALPLICLYFRFEKFPRLSVRLLRPID
jgi:hypothetical protein